MSSHPTTLLLLPQPPLTFAYPPFDRAKYSTVSPEKCTNFNAYRDRIERGQLTCITRLHWSADWLNGVRTG